MTTQLRAPESVSKSFSGVVSKEKNNRLKSAQTPQNGCAQHIKFETPGRREVWFYIFVEYVRKNGKHKVIEPQKVARVFTRYSSPEHFDRAKDKAIEKAVNKAFAVLEKLEADQTEYRCVLVSDQENPRNARNDFYYEYSGPNGQELGPRAENDDFDISLIRGSV